MNHWRILEIGDKATTFGGIRSELISRSPGCLLDLALTFEDGQELLLMYTYDVVIADFESSVASDLKPLIAERGFPVVAISENGLPRYQADIHIASVVHPDDPKETGLTVLRVLRHQGVMRLGSICNKILMWPYRELSKLIPDESREVNSYAKLLFY